MSLFVKPAPMNDPITGQSVARVIRDPVTRQPVPQDGGEVPDNVFWRRRLLDGDVVEVNHPQPAIQPLTTR